MGPAAARFYADPTAHLTMVAVTGTNGKTTTAFLVRALLEAAGRRCGLLGTVKSVVGGREREVVRTTPEAIDLQRDFAQMLAEGDEACVMEVSSHALELGRARAIHFDAAVFTNLTQDHLDFHPSMEDYFAAKRRLFEGPDAPRARIVNADDPYGRRLREALPDAITFALSERADYRARDVRSGFAGTQFVAETPDGPLELRSPLPGRFNVAQRARRGRGGARGRRRPRGHPARGGRCRAGAGALRARRRGSGLRRARRLRPHARLAGQRPARRAGARGRAAGAVRVRRRWRPRPRQASEDGSHRDAAGRRRGRHIRQPALRGPRGHRPRDRRGRRPRGGGDPRPSRGDRARHRPGAHGGRAASSPARATSRARSSAVGARCRSTT